MNRVIAYIDGFNLYFGMKEKDWKRYYWLDIEALARNLLLESQELRAVKYFTAIVSATPKDPQKTLRQTTYLEALRTSPRVQIFYGHYLVKTMKCFKCGATWATHEEKKTDVNMAIEMLNDAYQDRFDTALLISGDSDLAGIVEMVRRLFPMKRIVVAFPPARHSEVLQKAAHHVLFVGRDKLAKSQFPDALTKADGFTLHRPDKWR